MTYIIKSVSMSESFLRTEIESCLNSLYNTNSMLFDYWLNELFDDNDEAISENWNESNLNEMYKDVEVNQLNQLFEFKLEEALS